MCKYCENGNEYEITPCANGDLGIRACYMKGDIVLFENNITASGYFSINYCPMCGRKLRD